MSPAPRAPAGSSTRGRSSVRRTLRQLAERAYPEEVCGLLVEEGTAGSWRAIGAPNSAPDRRRAFAIDPDFLRRTEGAVARRGGRLVGQFHSHPDGPPEPSEVDRAAAWPGFPSVIVEVRQGRAGRVRGLPFAPPGDADASGRR